MMDDLLDLRDTALAECRSLAPDIEHRVFCATLAMLDRDPGKPAPTVGAIRATLARSVGRFERMERGLYELKEVRRAG